VNPRFEVLDAGKDPLADDQDRFEPVYPACADLDSRAIRRLISGLLPSVAGGLIEVLPEGLRAKRALPPRRTAYLRAHCPTRLEDAEIARRRLAYDELLLLQMVIQLVRARRRANRSATPVQVTELIDRRIRARFPFRFTAGQEAAVASITADLRESRPMNRLLQGDVGSGKTAVALYAALAAIAQRLQVALLAPTEVLAEQHFDKVRQYLEGSRVRLDLLTGGTPMRRRPEILRGARSGELDLLIGTHALIEESVSFGRLGLVVIDEQHKFGVAQRASVRGKGASPHCLVMTATPIPRTLAMTLFGDLDVATIADRPPGRRPVKTRRVRSAEMNRVWGFVRARLSERERGYVVYPAVEESDALPLRAAATEMERLRGGPLAGYEIALLHGRMGADEKERVMGAFRRGEVQVLVSTTVIEVGVDVPEATMMIVEQAERFGLSQLHQLRGRIGRGDRESHCILVSDAVDENACARLEVLCSTDDGFRIAEEDLRLRGPGEVLGKRQHGLPELKIADPLRDLELLEAARDDAAALIARDPKLCDRSHAGLRQALVRRFGSFLPVVELALA
jgi:ATP-dependent DNA helicase RecG